MPSPTNSIMSKFISTFKRFCNKEYGNVCLTTMLYAEKPTTKKWEYIDTNALKWKDDCFYMN